MIRLVGGELGWVTVYRAGFEKTLEGEGGRERHTQIEKRVHMLQTLHYDGVE